MEGDTDVYCCLGCETAAAIIRGAGLERYYQDREAYPPRPEAHPASWTGVTPQVHEDGSCELRLAVDGLRCASCVWVVEHVLQATPGVQAAAVSYATGRASLRWDPQRVDIGALAGRIVALGYRPRLLGEEAQPDRALLLRLGVAVFAAMNIMMLHAALYAGWWGGMDPAYATLFRWAALVLATPLTLWCASPFFAGAIGALRHGVLHMDVPLALAIGVLYVHGLVATLLGHDTYLDSEGMLVALLLAGRFLESRGRRRAAEAAVSLAAAAPISARRVRAEVIETVPVAALHTSDVIEVATGDEIPADGVVVYGGGTVRMALVTGEAEPVAVAPGDRVLAGTVLVSGHIGASVQAVGQGTLLGRMAAELQAAADRSVRPAAADRIAPWFTGLTLLVAALAFAGWYWRGGLPAALPVAIAVLVVACPCALALSGSLAAAAGLGAAARRGLLLRSGDTLADLRTSDTVALDKTGTVTAGALRVTAAEDAVLRIAAALERHSSHPIARAVLAATAERGIPLARASNVTEQPGFGITGEVDGRRWALRAGPPGVVELVALGRGDDSRLHGTLQLRDVIRADAAATVAALRAQGQRVVLLTGDHPEVAARIAAEAGITEVIARVDPTAKAEWVRAQQAQGRRILFVGDGLNDGLALAAPDGGTARAGGAASTLLVADGVISGVHIGPLLAGTRAARATARMIRVNQRRSIGYNILAVSAAVLGWINPLVAAVLMPISSGLVIWGSFRVEQLVREAESWKR
ncbi:MAG: heavy metal translocating P-type ATPase [Gemmatimonadetes bacterium]|nr:heavy metal translocating P-type ATPase [Gemmatimonadota bacterium]